MSRTLYLTILICLFGFLSSLTAQTRFQYTHQQMGTQIGLVFYENDKLKADSIAQLVFNRIDELNSTLSNYLPASEINQLSKRANLNVTVSDDLLRLLNISLDFAKRTNGAFDITLGPLIELWKKARENRQVPSIAVIKATQQRTGYDNVQFPIGNMVILKQEGMQLDVGGVGKGFAADEAIRLLKRNGINAALVDMGGDVTVSGAPPKREFWILGFSYFNENGEEIFQKVKLKNQAVATSGDLYQYAVIDGKRYSHIINPKNGMALSNNIQVTVLAPNGAMADAYASAFSVLGIAEGRKVIQEITDLEVFMVEDIPGAYKQWNSPGFVKSVVED